MKKTTFLIPVVLAVSTVLAAGFVVPLGSVQGSAPPTVPPTSPQTPQGPCIITEQGGGGSDVDTDTGSDVDTDIDCDFTGLGDIEGGGSQGPPP